MVLAFLDSYRETALADAAASSPDATELDLGSVAGLLDATRRGSRKQLLKRYAKKKSRTWSFRFKARGLSRIRPKTRTILGMRSKNSATTRAGKSWTWPGAFPASAASACAGIPCSCKKATCPNPS